MRPVEAALCTVGLGGVLWAFAALMEGAWAEALACLSIAFGAYFTARAFSRGAVGARVMGLALMAGGSLVPLLPSLQSIPLTHPALVMAVGFAVASAGVARSLRVAAAGLLLAAWGGIVYVRGDLQEVSWWTPGNVLVAVGVVWAAIALWRAEISPRPASRTL